MESIIDILLRVKDDAGAVISKVAKDVADLRSSAATIPGGATVSSLGSAAATAGSQAAQGAKGLQSMSEASRGLIGDVGSLKASLSGLLPALAGVLALSQLKGLADVGARIQMAGTVLGVVAQNAGISKGEITKLDKQVQALGITAEDSAKSLTQFIQAGLGGIRNESIGKIKELARAAQDLAVVSGGNSSDTFARMIVNIQQMDTMGMRFMGINVNMERATERFARQIGKTAAELSDAERKQAFMNATLVEAAKLTGAYEAAMGDAGKQLTSLPRLQNELRASISEGLQPAYSALIVTFSDFLKEAKKIADTWKAAGDGGLVFGDSVKKVAVVIKEVSLFLVDHAGLILSVVAAWGAAKVIGLLIPILGGVLTAFVSLTEVMIAFKAVNIAAMVLDARISFAAWALALKSGNIAEMLMAIRTGLIALRAGLLAVMPYLIPITIAITALWLAWDYVTNKISGKKVSIDTTEAEKELVGLMEKYQEAQVKANEARATANVGSKDPNEQKYLDKLAKEAQEEANLAKAKVDRLAKEKNLGAEQVAIADKQAAGNRALAITLKELEAEYDRLKNARQNLGVTDKDGLDSTKKAKKDLSDFGALFDKALADLGIKTETHSQRVNRVLEEGVETAKSIADKAAIAGLSVEEWLDKFHPKTEAIASWGSLKQAIEQGGAGAEQAFRDASAAFDNLLERAKSPDQIYVLLAGLGEYAEVFGARVKAAKETLSFRAETAELQSLNTATLGFTENLKQLRVTTELLTAIQDDAIKSDRAWEQVITNLGGAFNALGEYAAGAQGGLNLFKDVTAQVSATQAEAGASSLALAKQRYVNEEALLVAEHTKKKGLIAERSATEKAAATALTALDKELATKRMDNAKQLYSTLKSLQAEALNSFKEYATKVKELDKSIAASKEAKEADLREIRRKGLTEEEQQADKLAEYYETLAKAQEAIQKGAFEKAQEYATKAKEIAKGLGDSIDLTQQAELVGDAWDLIIQSQQKAKEEAKKAAAEQLEAYKEMTAAVTDLSEQLKSMAEDKTAKIMIDVDKESLRAAIEQVNEEFSKLTVRVSVTADTSGVQGYAIGGHIDGPGTETSDSILAAVSKNEYIEPARTVRYYGVDVFHALRNMSIPRDLLRSLLSGGMFLPRFALGGPVGHVPVGMTPLRDEVDLNLTYNHRKVGTVRGSRSTVNGLVDALHDLSRGTY